MKLRDNYTTQLSLSFHAKVATVVPPGGTNLPFRIIPQISTLTSWLLAYSSLQLQHTLWDDLYCQWQLEACNADPQDDESAHTSIHQSEVLCTFGSLHNSSNHSNLVRIYVCNFLSALTYLSLLFLYLTFIFWTNCFSTVTQLFLGKCLTIVTGNENQSLVLELRKVVMLTSLLNAKSTIF